MWIMIAIIILVALLWANVYESMTSSPYDMVQEQAGSIQHIHDKLNKVSFTEASIGSLQSENDQTTNQINQLQTNMPSPAVDSAYPPE